MVASILLPLHPNGSLAGADHAGTQPARIDHAGEPTGEKEADAGIPPDAGGAGQAASGVHAQAVHRGCRTGGSLGQYRQALTGQGC